MAQLKNLILGDRRDPREELGEIFETSETMDRSDSTAVTWARGVLAQKGVDRKDQVRAIKVMREAEPRLGLKSATYLAAIIAR